jgi:hypothetical protein
MPPPKVNVRALQLSLEGLFKLLGGSEDDRQRFWERLKGITTPREAFLVNAQIESLSTGINAVRDGVKGLQNAAKQKV